MANTSSTLLLTNLLYDNVPHRVLIPQPPHFTSNGGRAMPYCRPKIRTRIVETLYSNPSKSLAEEALNASMKAIIEPGFRSMHDIPLSTMTEIITTTRIKLCDTPADCCGACISDSIAVYFEVHPETFRGHLDVNRIRRRVFFHILTEGFYDQRYQQPSPYPVTAENFASDFWWAVLEEDIGMARFKLDKMAVFRSNLQAKAVILYNHDNRYVNRLQSITTTPRQQSLWAIHLKHHPSIVPLVKLNDHVKLDWMEDYMGWWFNSGRLDEQLRPRKDELRGGPEAISTNAVVPLTTASTANQPKRERK